MIAIVVEFVVGEEHATAFRERVLRQAEDSLREEPECHRFDVCLDPAQPLRILLYELYTDRAAFDAHLASAHFKAFDAEVAAWVREKSVGQWDLLDR